MRHHRGATARRRSFKSKAPLWIATEHREQGRADIRQRIEQVRLVPLADMLGSNRLSASKFVSFCPFYIALPTNFS